MDLKLAKIIKSRAFLRFLAVLFLCLTASYSIVYTAIQYFSDSNAAGNTDALKYLAMYRQEAVDGPWRFRVLTPFLARILPDPPKTLFNADRQMTAFWVAKVKFGLVNLFFLLSTGVLFFYFLIKLGLRSSESLIGVLLFYTARPVVQSAGVPMVEASSYFFILLCLYAMLHNNIFVLVISFFVGIFAKDTAILLVFPAILLSRCKHKFKAVFFMLIGIAIYVMLFSVYLYPEYREIYLSLKLAKIGHQISVVFSFNKMLDLLSSFGLLWIPCLYAFIRGKLPSLLYRWGWLIVIILGKIILWGGDLGRILFFAFPVVIPSAIFGIRLILGLPASGDISD